MVSIKAAGTTMAMYIGILVVVTVLFLIFKLNEWGIIWVLSPIWLGTGVFILIFFGKWIHLIIASSIEHKVFIKKRKNDKIEAFLKRKE